jgi:hypothetical protein
VRGRSWIQIWVRNSAILSEIAPGVPQSLQKNARKIGGERALQQRRNATSPSVTVSVN